MYLQCRLYKIRIHCDLHTFYMSGQQTLIMPLVTTFIPAPETVECSHGVSSESCGKAWYLLDMYLLSAHFAPAANSLLGTKTFSAKYYVNIS